MRSVVAVDVGGTTIKTAVVDASGRILRHDRIATPVEDGPAAVVQAIRTAVADLVAAAGVEVAAVGLAVPGFVDAGAGRAIYSANLGWRDVPLRALVAQDTGLPTVLDHDVRAAGVAESVAGRTRDVGDSLLVVIGTGIAGVVTVAGTAVTGASGLAGELGHLPVWPDGERCPCGQQGCLERYASAAAISRRYADRTGTALPAEEVCRRRESDPAAARVWDEAVEALALGLATCTMALDPALIVLGGGLAQAGSDLLDPVRRALELRVRWRPVPAVELSPLGPRAGLIGAGILAARAAGLEGLG